VLAVFVFVALWLNGWFYPLILLPFFYVKLMARKSFGWIGFRWKGLLPSAVMGTAFSFATILIWYPIFTFYMLLLKAPVTTPYVLFTDVFWCPLYEEVAYRGFFFANLTDEKAGPLSKGGLAANLAQTVLFLSVHHNHVTSGTPLFLIPVGFLALANGLLFLKTRNLFGCIMCHSLTNGLAHLIRAIAC